MKRKDEIELRRAVNLALRAQAHRDNWDAEYGGLLHRVRVALNTAIDAGGLSESAQAYLTAERSNLNTFRYEATSAQSKLERELTSLASLLGIR